MKSNNTVLLMLRTLAIIYFSITLAVSLASESYECESLRDTAALKLLTGYRDDAINICEKHISIHADIAASVTAEIMFYENNYNQIIEFSPILQDHKLDRLLFMNNLITLGASLITSYSQITDSTTKSTGIMFLQQAMDLYNSSDHFTKSSIQFRRCSMHLIEVMIQDNRLKDAQNIAMDLLLAQPLHPSGHASLGVALYMGKNMQGAISSLSIAVELVLKYKYLSLVHSIQDLTAHVNIRFTLSLC